MNPMTGNAVSIWVAELGIWPLVVVLVPNLMFRKYGQAAGRKRMASLFQAIGVFALTTAAAFIAERELTDIYFFIAVVVVAIVLYIFRGRVFPYRLTCAECDVKLDFRTIYFMDDNLCPKCHEARVAREEAEAAGEEPEPTGVTDAGSDDSGEEDHPWPGSGNAGGDNEDES